VRWSASVGPRGVGVEAMGVNKQHTCRGGCGFSGCAREEIRRFVRTVNPRLTGVTPRVYDSSMFLSRKVRPVVCLLLAVATAIGAVAPARACACTTPPPATPQAAGAKGRVAAACGVAETAKSCCQPTAKKRSCCSPTSTCSTASTAKASCCADKAPADRGGKTPAPTAPASTDSPGCHCLRCECDAPGAPQVPANPAPVVPDADEPASLVPPVLTSAPRAAAAPAVRSTPVGPPPDLVISLSRLTC
jgi:hypothetical protein